MDARTRSRSRPPGGAVAAAMTIQSQAGGNSSYTAFGDATTRSAPNRAAEGEVEKYGPPARRNPHPPTSPAQRAPAQPASGLNRRARQAPATGIIVTTSRCSESSAEVGSAP